MEIREETIHLPIKGNGLILGVVALEKHVYCTNYKSFLLFNKGDFSPDDT